MWWVAQTEELEEQECKKDISMKEKNSWSIEAGNMVDI